MSGYVFVDAHRIDSAPFAGDAKCDTVLDRLPEEVLSNSRDWVIGEGTAAWGGRKLTLRCGVPELDPTTDLCVSADGVDWVLDEATLKETGKSVLTTYGRSPAIEVTYSGRRENAGDVLTSLTSSVDWIPQRSRCLDLNDV
ncbi:DUF3515 family protein [Streptomyces sp. NPDC052051]|uniref:DUF3515 family protein n=1 Tax=Streptomyces sp. NPDC052051 TaxID=3154649 RepID=UPI00343D3BE3